MTGQRIAITGSTGLIGGALSAFLRERGDTVVRLVRRPAVEPLEFRLPGVGESTVMLSRVLENVDAVVNLAGAGIADHRWTSGHKDVILRSRVETTGLLVRALAPLDASIRFVSASGISIYGDRGEEVLDENSTEGNGFLADVVRAWEGTAMEAADAGHAVATARTGLVVSARGGAFGRMALPARMGLGGPLGSGRQWWSWISLRDEARAWAHLLDTPAISGPVNLVAPRASRQRELAAALGRSLRRPAVLPVPAPALRIALGAMSQEVLASTRVRPRVLTESGFEWQDSNADQVLDRLADALRSRGSSHDVPAGQLPRA